MTELTDPTRFAAFYDETLPIIYSYLYHRCGRRHDVAQDLTQEVFLAAVAAARKGSVEVTTGWLVGVARHKFVDFVRARQRDDARLRLVRDVAERGVEISAWRGAGMREDVISVLGELPPDQRAALVLFHLDGLTTAEVAECLGKSVRATESLLVRARQAFRGCFKEADHA